MSQVRVNAGPWGTVVSCKGCGRVLMDEDRVSEEQVEAAIEEHECVEPTWP